MRTPPRDIASNTASADVGRQITRCQDDYAKAVFRPEEIGPKVADLRAQERGLRARIEAVRLARTHAARLASETEDTKKLLRTLATRAKSASAQTRADVLRTLVRRAKTRWEGDAVHLHVTYGFDAPTPALAAMTSTDRGA